MSKNDAADVMVYLCRNCIPGGGRLARQWQQDGYHVRIEELPCSGKMDAQYHFHAFEGGVQALLVVACNQGECRLAQGNYRAEVRVRTVKRLLDEIGLEPERIELLRCSADDPPERLEELVRQAVAGFVSLGKSAVSVQT